MEKAVLLFKVALGNSGYRAAGNHLKSMLAASFAALLLVSAFSQSLSDRF
jgi:hypothetical protein